LDNIDIGGYSEPFPAPLPGASVEIALDCGGSDGLDLPSA